MGTRAVYTFIAPNELPFHVYSHYYNCPEGACAKLEAALNYAWPLPRFEHDEFAAAFIRANKFGNGNMRLTHDWRVHGDLEWRYEILSSPQGNDLVVIVWLKFSQGAVNGYTKAWSGSLRKFRIWAGVAKIPDDV